jgi:hypothetical protein
VLFRAPRSATNFAIVVPGIANLSKREGYKLLPEFLKSAGLSLNLQKIPMAQTLPQVSRGMGR